MDESRRGIGAGHIPFRQSKLTLALRDSFIDSKDEESKMIMIGCVSPGSTFTDYSLNTLWYASKLGGNKKYVASKYKNANYINSSTSLNTSQLVRAKTGLNTSYDQTDKLSLQPTANAGLEHDGIRPSIEVDGSRVLHPVSCKDVVADKGVSQRKTLKSEQSISRNTGLSKAVSTKKVAKEEPRKGLFTKQVESARKIDDDRVSRSSKDESPNKSDLLVVYLDTLKQESDLIRKESKMIADGGNNPSSSLTRNKKVLTEHIQSKIDMLLKLQQSLSN